MMNNLQPRLRGMAYEEKKQWHWEIIITFGDMSVEDDEAIVMADRKTAHISKDAAVMAMKKEIPRITDLIGSALNIKDLSKSGFYDLRKGFSHQTLEEFNNKPQ